MPRYTVVMITNLFCTPLNQTATNNNFLCPNNFFLR